MPPKHISRRSNRLSREFRRRDTTRLLGVESLVRSTSPWLQTMWALGVGIEEAHRKEELARAEQIERASIAEKRVEAEHREAERKKTVLLETKLADADRVAAEHRAKEHTLFGIPTYLAHKDEREARAADEALHENIAAERAALEREARTKSANRADEACESSNEGTRRMRKIAGYFRI